MSGILNGRVRTASAICVCFLGFLLSPLGAQSPRIQATPSPLQFGEVFLGESTTRTIDLANIGGAPLEIASVTVGGSGSGYFTAPAIALPATVAPGERMIAEVTYTPDRRGPDQGILVVESNDPDQPVLSVALSGTGEFAPVPRIFVSSTAIDFGGTPVGTTSGRTLTIRNNGVGTLNLTGLVVTQGMDRAFAVGGGISAPLELKRNESLQVQIVYRPIDEGLDSARLLVQSDDADTPVVTVFLTGRGISVTAARVAVTPSSLEYGDVVVGLRTSLSVTIANVGLRQLKITSIVIDPESSPAFVLIGGPVSATLTTGDELTINVGFTPSEGSVHTGTLRIESNDTEEPLVTVALSGSGVLPLFRRGDANADGEVDLSDAISVLGQLFGSVPAPLCLDASDTNDDSIVDVSDAVFALVWLFGEENELPAPGAEDCGIDPTDDGFATCEYPLDLCDA